ncbi:MAG: c-type cytochrome [Verrucomicrobiales bacterium]|nr:c-type cytochrome [Verrucomicrobiales bacterium]
MTVHPHRLMLPFLLVLGPTHAEDTGPRSPSSERESLHLADPGLIAELVAAEPEISSPVAMAWDEAGSLYVAEMQDYPVGPGGGTIRLLRDLDGDGRYERATLFADHLEFPNSVLPWKGGVLVTAAPDLWYLRDNDGDGRAEERRAWFTGFGTGNQQLRANGLFWGLDGWVYGANGRSDGRVRPAGSPEAAAVSIRGRDFRLDPSTGAFETLAGRSQFGLGRDDWGQRFLSWNTIPVRHEVIPDAYLARNPGTAAADALQDCLPAGDRGEVFPRTPPPLVFNNESGQHFNALSGLHIFRGDALGSDYSGNAFVGESLRNLIHRRVLVPDGPTFRAERRESQSEFLSSSDPWFHPVNMATGPDGALYVADFYRRFVEHPDWVAREMRGQVPWAEGRGHGRIWRVRRKGNGARAGDLASFSTNASARQILGMLDHPNGWHRDTAQRLLRERFPRDPLGAMTSPVLEGRRPEGRVAWLYTWAILGGRDPGVLEKALGDADPHVRAAALHWIGLGLSSAASSDATSRRYENLLAAAAPRFLGTPSEIRDSREGLEFVLALGFVREPAFRESILSRIARLSTNRWILLACAAGSQEPHLAALARPATPSPRPPPAPQHPDPNRTAVLDRLRPALQMTGDPARGAATVSRLCLSCHYLKGRGQRIGPDLSGATARSPESLLVDLFDPSRQIAPDYTEYEVELNSGEKLTGLIASETSTRLTLRHPGSPDVSVSQSEVRQIGTTGRSLMPVGLEEGLRIEDVADLIAFIRSPDAAPLP